MHTTSTILCKEVCGEENLVLLSLPNQYVFLLNALVWPSWGFFSGWWYRQKSYDDLFAYSGTREIRTFEQDGSWYERRLRIKRWKDRLPETGSWFGPISKRHLPGSHTDQLRVFAYECHRGELTHWAILSFSPVPALWTTGWLLVLSCVIGLCASLPFVAVLRYNRCRIERILDAA
jgi:glycosyl-4,4'-diaponeurosporenoate acyltransferase